MTHLYLIRHGENVDGKISDAGPTIDLGLSAEGRRQVRLLAHRLQSSSSIRPAFLLSSTERRAGETATAIGAAIGLEVDLRKELEEWRSDDGNITPEAFMAEWTAIAERQRAFHRFQPSSETQAEFLARVGNALHRICSEHAGESVAVVTHGGFIQVAHQHFFGFGDASFRRAYAASAHASITLWRAEAGGQRWVLEYSNDTAHLQNAA